MKVRYNHTEAQEIYRDRDPSEETYKEIIENMRKSVILPDFVCTTGRHLVANSGLENEELINKFIIVAEAMYRGLEDDEVREHISDNEKLCYRTKEELFDLILSNLCFSLYDYQYGIIGTIEDMYEETE